MLNKTYTETSNIEQLKTLYDKEGHVQMQDFVEDLHVPETWNESKQLLTHWIHTAQPSTQDMELVKEIAPVVAQIVNKQDIDIQAVWIKCEHENYALMQAELFRDVCVIIDPNTWDEQWGGIVHFANGQGEVLPLPAIQGSATLIDGTQLFSYIQYVNHHAKHARTLLVLHIH